ncbi:MAG: hypothetical protein V3U98_00445, partial [Acidobacteriota bacterium]
RPDLGTLWKQIFTVGLVKARILRKHPDILRWKYALPSLFVLSAGASLAAALFSTVAGPPLVAVAGIGFLTAYALVAGSFCLSRAPRLGWSCLWLLSILPVLHTGYGLGFLRGLLEYFRPRTAS